VNLIKKNANFYILVLALFYILIDAFLMANDVFWFNLLPIALFLAYLAFLRLDIFLFLIVIFIPFSISLRSLFPELSFDLSLPTEPMIIIAMFIFIFKFLLNENFDKKVLVHPVTIAIILNITWIFIACITSEMPIVSFKFLISRCWFVIVFYFLASQLFFKFKNIIKYIWLYSLSMIFVIGYFIVRLISEGMSNQRAAVWIIKPFYNDHTAYGAALAMIVIALIGFYFIKRNAKYSTKFFYVLTILIYLCAIVFSYTRATWLSMFLASGFLIALIFKIRMNIIFLAIAILVVMFSVYQSEILISLKKNKQGTSNNMDKHLKSMTNIKSDESNLERVNRWNSALRMFKEKPLFGFGPGTYAFKYAPYQAYKDRTTISTNTGNLGNSHSEYIGPLAESGLFGSLTFIAIVLTTIFTASRVYFQSNRRKVKIMALTLLIAMLTYYIHGFLNNFLDTDKLSALFWGFTAMIVALDIYHNKSKEKKRSIFYY
jgi:putative inorganic carbon (hco3(-)) transporter